MSASDKQIADLTAAKAAADDLLIEAVRSARQDGLSWTDIGKAFDITKQAAHQRFSHQIKE